MTDDCIFCKIVAGEIPSEQLYKDELVTAFRDISPRTPTHILIIPNLHYSSLAEMGDEEAETLGRIVSVANHLAKQEGVAESGYRLLTNIGDDGGQEVYHTHFHLLGGRRVGPIAS